MHHDERESVRGAATDMDPKGTEALLYTELADWWPLLSSPEEYAEEAAVYTRAISDAASGPVRRVLELGSGGGNNASHMKAHFQLTLVDRASGMLAVSRTLNPECEHVIGDMRTVRLGRTFDAVFVHDAICYMTTPAALREAVATAVVHLRPGGVVLLAPDYTTEVFAPHTSHGGYDGEDRALRYLEWAWDPDPSDTTIVVDYAFSLRDGADEVRVVPDRHIEGLFPRAHWLQTLTDVGLDARAVPFAHSEVDYAMEVFVGRKPA